MKRKNLIKCINNYDSIFELLTNDPDVYEKLNDEFKFRTIQQAEKELINSNDSEKSFVEWPNKYIKGLAMALYTNRDEIELWTRKSNKQLILNPHKYKYNDFFLKSLEQIGYNYKKVSSSNIRPEIEIRELVGLEVVLEKDEENIYIKDVFPNNNMLRDFVLPDDQTKVKTKEQIQSEDKITQEEANQMLMEIKQKALESFKDDIEELEPEDELSK